MYTNHEWNEDIELEWYLLENPLHKGMQEYVKELLKIYQNHSCLYEIDNSWNGFEWINVSDAEKSTYSFIRKNKKGMKSLLFVLNLTPVVRNEYRIGVPNLKKYKLLVYFDKIRHNYRNEKLFMIHILYVYLMRHEIDLENICNM